MSEETKPRIVKSHDINLDSDYVNWIHDVKQRYICLLYTSPSPRDA